MDYHLSFPQPACDVTEFRSDPGKDMRDNEYYFELVVLKVGDTLFRVPKNGLLVPGTIFEAMFSLPTTEGNVEGLNDQNPIHLLVDEKNFRGFLRAVYPFNGLQLENADWLGALDLSTTWMFDEMRDRAIKELDPWIESLGAKEVTLLAKKYRVLKWLKSGYNRLLQQPSLTAAELNTVPSLDWETIARLLSVKLLRPQLSYHFDGSGMVVQSNIFSALEQEFSEEFSSMN